MLDVLIIAACVIALLIYIAILTVPAMILAFRTRNEWWLLLLFITVPFGAALLNVAIECWGIVDWIHLSDCLTES